MNNFSQQCNVSYHKLNLINYRTMQLYKKGLIRSIQVNHLNCNRSLQFIKL
jgi:hypothetical protein